MGIGSCGSREASIDARRGEIYGAVYNSDLRLVQDEVVMPVEQWQAMLPPGAERISIPHRLAAAVAGIAAERYARGEASDPAALDANYVRRSDAELFWKE